MHLLILQKIWQHSLPEKLCLHQAASVEKETMLSDQTQSKPSKMSGAERKKKCRKRKQTID